jgi:patatin-related protein
MSSPPSASTPRLSPECGEIRLGLVVYGGVSLAIYINGVAHELFRAVRGRGVYKLLKRILDADIVVDIVSGTSAGGINGMLLAYALINEREFGDCAELWREHGSLARLLRTVDDEDNATSLLNSRDYFLPQLEDALRSMSRISPTLRADEASSRFDELDLFVTGTDFDGRLTTTCDATGRQIDIKSHRTVFHLKHRARRKTPFDVSPTGTAAADRVTISALARLAAITSCFPAAFEPVHVCPSTGDAHENAIYASLKEWGALNGDTWFLDGGVLDNKPFSYTIQQIFNRTASRPVDRKLFYVEPDPERFDPSSAAQRSAPPSAVQAAVEALIGIPGYESIAEDLAAIAKRNDLLQRQQRLRSTAEKAFEHLRDATKHLSASQALPSSVRAVYQQVRLTQLSDRAMQGLLENDEGFDRPVNHQWKDVPLAERAKKADEVKERREAAKLLAPLFDQWAGDGARTLERFDPYFRLRRAFYMTYQIGAVVSKLSNPGTEDEPKQAARRDRLTRLKHAWETLNQQVSTYEIVQWAMEQALDRQPLPTANSAPRTRSKNEEPEEKASRVWKALAARLELLLEVDEKDEELARLFQAPAAGSDGPAGFSETDRETLHKILIARLEARRSPRAHHIPDPNRPNLLMKLDEHTERLLRAQLSCAPGLMAKWDDFLLYDAHFFPIDYFAGLGEKDAIDVVRVSPFDANRAFCARRFEDKITGEAVMHFGAFLKRSWRSNDIMWGRLDGVCRMLDALLTPEALEKAMQRSDVRTLLRQDLESGILEPATLFPDASKESQQQLRRWLEQLSSEHEPVRKAAAHDTEMHTLLLWCAQLGILNTDLPTVLEDAAIEQIEWNSRVVRTGPSEARFTPLASHIDLAPAITAGRELTRQFVDRSRRSRRHPRIRGTRRSPDISRRTWSARRTSATTSRQPSCWKPLQRRSSWHATASCMPFRATPGR